LSTTSISKITVPPSSKCMRCRRTIDGNGFRCKTCGALYCENCMSLVRQEGVCLFCKLKIVQEESTPAVTTPRSQTTEQEAEEPPTQPPPRPQEAVLIPATVPPSSKCVYCHQQIGTGQAFRCSICGALYDTQCINTLRQTSRCLFCGTKIQSFPSVDSASPSPSSVTTPSRQPSTTRTQSPSTERSAQHRLNSVKRWFENLGRRIRRNILRP